MTALVALVCSYDFLKRVGVPEGLFLFWL